MKVLVCAFHYQTACTEGRRLMEDAGLEVIYNPNTVPYTREEILEIIPEIDAVISGNEIWDEEVYARAPKLKLIARFGIGVDNIDIPAAKKHGILVCNAPGATNGVAELTVAWMIVMSRHLMLGNRLAKSGRWDRCFGTEVRGKKIGLLGFGRIPKLIARKMVNFDAQLFAFDQYPDREYAARCGVTITDMDTILRTCDIVSLHLPATPETRGIMDAKAFAAMKDGAFFINTGRGALVDEAALYEALASGHLGAAAADVFAKEPVTADNPLLTLENFYCTPHWGSDTHETLALVGKLTAQAVTAVLCRGEAPEYLLN